MDGWFPRFFRTRFVLFVRVEKAGYLVKSSSFNFIDGVKYFDAWHRKMGCNHGVQQLRVSADRRCLTSNSDREIQYSIRKIMWHMSEESRSSLLYGESRGFLPVLRWCTCSIPKRYHRTRVVVRIDAITVHKNNGPVRIIPLWYPPLTPESIFNFDGWKAIDHTLNGRNGNGRRNNSSSYHITLATWCRRLL